MIRFARSVTNEKNAKSHAPHLKALHSKSFSPQLSASGIRSVTRNCYFHFSEIDLHIGCSMPSKEHFAPSVMGRDALIGSVGARPQKEDLLRTLLCLAISATVHQKPAGDTHRLVEVVCRYCVSLVPTLNDRKT